MDQHHPSQAALVAQLPVTTTTTDGHPTPAANPTPTHPQNPPSHPSYAEMITAAILWDNSQGKEGGSSKRAIAKYIDRVYTNLPPTHSALLTHNLRRLKNSGHLVMVRNSYQLPSLAAPVAPVRSAAATSGPDSPTPKKGPGRPPKPKSEQPTLSNVPALGVDNGLKRSRGRPPKQPQLVAEVPFVQPISEVQGQVVYAPDPGLYNGQPVQKRRPGRPSKQQFVQSIPHGEAQAQAQHPPNLGLAVPVNGAEAGVLKRGPGRPRKANVGGYGPGGPAGGSARPRGRAKKNALGLASRAVGKRPRGRPPKQVGVGAGAGAAPGGAVGMKRRGRPPKGSGPLNPVRKYTGKRRGRPRKDAVIARKQASDREQAMFNEELMRKLENMQLKIRDAVYVLRPHLANENASEALTVLQELEDLSAVNLNAPPALTEPPEMTIPMDVTVQADTSVPVPQTIADAPAATVTAPTMGPPGLFGIAGPTVTVTAPLHAPSSIESHHPISWIPSSEAQF